MPAPTAGLVRERVVDIGATLGWYRYGAADPTTWTSVAGRGPASSGRFVRATITPEGPGTIELTWGRAVEPDAAAVEAVPGLSVRTFGPAAAWLAGRAGAMAGADDSGDESLRSAPHRAVADAARARDGVRFGASGDLYHELLPTIIGQRITAGEAYRQWRELCRALGEPAPGPFEGLLLPPAPEVVARTPSWWFHPLGIERKRAEVLIEVARHPRKLWSWAQDPADRAATMLARLRGVGQWTIGSVLGPALGDPDAVAVGDYHLKNTVGWALAGEARATDERMMELLEPYRGQRGRVTRLLKMNGNGAPRFGPKKRILPMRDW
jgi:endonuclease III